MCQFNYYWKAVNESELESSFIHSFVSECLDNSSKAPEYVSLANDVNDNDHVV